MKSAFGMKPLRQVLLRLLVCFFAFPCVSGPAQAHVSPRPPASIYAPASIDPSASRLPLVSAVDAIVCGPHAV